MRRFLFVFVVGGAAVVTAFAGSSFAGAQSPTTTGAVTNVRVVLRDFSIVLSTSTVPAGTVVFSVLNDAQSEHNFSIGGRTTPNIRGGREETLTVNFPYGGPQTYRCTIGNHASLGMKGTLTIKGAAEVKPTATLNVSEKEWKMRLTTSTGAKVGLVKHGLIRFTVRNNGRRPHNFVLGKKSTRVLKRGEHQVLDVVLKRGIYRYSSSVKGDTARGMKGVLRVT